MSFSSKSLKPECEYRPEGPETEPNELKHIKPKKRRKNGSFKIQTTGNAPLAKLTDSKP